MTAAVVHSDTSRRMLYPWPWNGSKLTLVGCRGAFSASAPVLGMTETAHPLDNLEYSCYLDAGTHTDILARRWCPLSSRGSCVPTHDRGVPTLRRPSTRTFSLDSRKPRVYHVKDG